MKLLTVDTIDEARRKLLDCITASREARREARHELDSEEVETGMALGRILASDITAPEDLPNFRRSTVDGYAVFSADTVGAGESLPVLLRLAGAVEMGKPAGLSLARGQCAYVPTGGMIPDGADAMVMVEYTEALDGTGGREIAVYESAAVGSHVARVGEDIARGELLLRRGTSLRFREAGALAAVGITRVPVYVPLRISIISSGDELVRPPRGEPSGKPSPGEVRDVNTPALEALAKESYYRVVGVRTVRDDEGELEAAVRDAMEKSDVVALSGGSSQGTKDMTARVFSALASPGVFTHGLAVKPGKPTVLGYDEKTGTVLAGLPGHPVSALMVFRILFSWLTARLTGRGEPFPVPARISCNLAGSPGRTGYQPVVLRPHDGGYLAEPVFGKAGMIATLTRSDGYIVIDLNREGLKKGEAVQVFPWAPGFPGCP